MENASLENYANGQQAFIIKDGQENLAEMVVGIAGKIMTVYHTEVSPRAEGLGLAKILLKAMVDYARHQQLKVIPLCVFVLAQFKRHPELYSDIWQKNKA